MKSRLQKGEVGTMTALFVLVIIGMSTLVSSVFLSQKQITSSKASSIRLPPPTVTLVPTTTHAKSPSPTSVPCQKYGKPCSPSPTLVPKICDKTGRYNVGKCGENTCSSDMIFKCDWYTKDNQGTCGGNKCKCEPDVLCITPTPTPAPVDVPADATGLGGGSANQTGIAYCPDGGITESNGASCDYGRESAGNSVYIDKDNPDDCRKCIWVKYDGSFPYGQCHYANSSVCRRSDNVGGCAGVCNATCCSDNSPKENGDDYDQVNIPGSSGIISPDTWQGNSVVDTGTGGEEFTANQDTTLIGEKICDIDGSYTYFYCDWEKGECVQGVPPEPCNE